MISNITKIEKIYYLLTKSYVQELARIYYVMSIIKVNNFLFNSLKNTVNVMNFKLENSNIPQEINTPYKK